MYYVFATLITLIFTATAYANTFRDGCLYEDGYDDCYYDKYYYDEDDSYYGCANYGAGTKRDSTKKASNKCKNKRCTPEYFNAYVGTGYRQDEFQFSIAGDDEGSIPNIAREMKWSKLQILPFTAYADYRHPCGFVFKLYGDYGRIYYGRGTNEEWLGQNRTNPFLFDKALANRGSVWDMGGGIGYCFRLFADYWMITPIIGYDQNQQYYQMYDVTRDIGIITGHIKHVHYSYQSLWRGPWAGVEMKCGPWLCDMFWLRLGYDWHYMLFNARLKDSHHHQLLNTDTYCKRQQSSHAQGNHLWAGIDYHCVKQWSGGVYASWKDYHAKSGTQVSKCSTGLGNRKVRFNGGKWQTFDLILTIGYHY